MKKKLYSFISILIGAGVIVASFLVRKNVGAWFYLIFGIGIVSLIFSVAEFYSLCKGRKKAGKGYDSSDLKKEKPKYRKKSAIMTGAEISLYNTLTELFADKYLVLPQVTLNSVIDKITQNAYRNELFRVADFCIVENKSYAPLVLIELNDSSHNRMDRIERDKRVAEICQSAKMPLVTFLISDLKDKGHIKRELKKFL